MALHGAIESFGMSSNVHTSDPMYFSSETEDEWMVMLHQLCWVLMLCLPMTTKLIERFW